MDNKMVVYDKICEITKLMLNNAARKNDNANIVLSPVSLVFAMALALDATNGATKEEIKKFLGKDLTAQELDELISDVQKILSYTQNVRSANAVVSSIDIKPEYKDTVRKNYNAECFSEDKVALVDRVNSWVKRKTAGMIPKLLSEDSDIDVCLINAITFIADWAEEYDNSDVEEDVSFKPFTGKLEKGTFLNSMEDSYIETEDCTGFSKKYKGEEYEFIALLPKENQADALNNLINGLDIKALLSKKHRAKVSVRMPEFKIEFNDELSQFCKDNGIKKAFNKTADFSSMTDVSPTYVNKIIQNAYIKVDRYGTRAAAATATLLVGGCAFLDDIKKVVLNRPFVYAIIHSETGIPVFTGIVNHIK